VVQYTVNKMAATVGQKLLGLQYISTSSDKPGRWMSHRQRVLYAVLTIAAAWLKNRLDDLAALARHVISTAQVCFIHNQSLICKLLSYDCRVE